MKNELNVPRGTSLSLGIQIQQNDGSPYSVQSGDAVYFAVKKDVNGDACINKTAAYNAESNCFVVKLEPEDTSSLPFGRYWYDIGLQTEEGDFYTVIPATYFNILYAVTGKVTGT